MLGLKSYQVGLATTDLSLQTHPFVGGHSAMAAEKHMTCKAAVCGIYVYLYIYIHTMINIEHTEIKTYLYIYIYIHIDREM